MHKCGAGVGQRERDRETLRLRRDPGAPSHELRSPPELKSRLGCVTDGAIPAPVLLDLSFSVLYFGAIIKDKLKIASYESGVRKCM